MKCVGCGCTEKKTCGGPDGPCAWVDPKFPWCTACHDRAAKQLVPGARVRIGWGQHKGELGVVVDARGDGFFRVRRDAGDSFHAVNLKLEK